MEKPIPADDYPSFRESKRAEMRAWERLRDKTASSRFNLEWLETVIEKRNSYSF